MKVKRPGFVLEEFLVENDNLHKDELSDKNEKKLLKKSVKHYNIEKLVSELTEPEVWLEYIEDDLMKYWTLDAAKNFVKDLFPTYRTNKGELLPENHDLWPEEYKEAEKDKDVKGLIDPDYSYIRAHSRQTYAYGVAYHVTGNASYLELCKKGTMALINAIDGNDGMFTKQNIRTGEWKDKKQERTSQDLAYGLLGMGMYYYLTHDTGVLYKIIQVKNYIFDTYFDYGKGLITWYPKENDDADFEIVAQLDQIYAYMLFLTPSLPEPYQSEWKKNLKELVDIMLHRFYSERYEFFWGQDTNSSVQQLGKDHTDFGHSVKTMWLIYQVGLLVGEMSYVIFAREKIDKILKEAYIVKTGTWGRRFDENGKIDPDKEWWISAELDQACEILALNDPSYLVYINNTHKYWFEYMVDKEYGEVWHMVDGKTNKPKIQYPKIHSWKASLHTFEHALFGYMTSSQIKGKAFDLYYAFSSKEEVAYNRTSPYVFKANINNVKELNELPSIGGKNKKIRVTYDTLR